jgi:hypothetical protein
MENSQCTSDDNVVYIKCVIEVTFRSNERHCNETFLLSAIIICSNKSDKITWGKIKCITYGSENVD